jgi:hypothetical protein
LNWRSESANVLVASGFSIAAIVHPQYLVSAESVPTEASLLLAMYAAARTISLALADAAYHSPGHG